MSRAPNIVRSAIVESGKPPESGDLKPEDWAWIIHHLKLSQEQGLFPFKT